MLSVYLLLVFQLAIFQVAPYQIYVHNLSFPNLTKCPSHRYFTQLLDYPNNRTLLFSEIYCSLCQSSDDGNKMNPQTFTEITCLKRRTIFIVQLMCNQSAIVTQCREINFTIHSWESLTRFQASAGFVRRMNV
jgi:Tfp pilus assembly ATPase PilU